VATYLDTIIRAHRARAARDDRDIAALVTQAKECSATRGFQKALCPGSGGMSVIAEIKRRSPSKGDLAPGLVPDVLAKAYAGGGARCLSVLTDNEFFGGSLDDLAQARAAVGLPVLRKDFTVSAADVCDARLAGADALLLIVSALSPGELGDLLALSRQVGLDALVEVHDDAEAELALAAGAEMIGVNQRDLMTFEVDTGRAARVAAHLPSGVAKVAESGIHNREDVRRLESAGYDAVLVGEALVTARDPGAALAALTAGAP